MLKTNLSAVVIPSILILEFPKDFSANVSEIYGILLPNYQSCSCSALSSPLHRQSRTFVHCTGSTITVVILMSLSAFFPFLTSVTAIAFLSQCLRALILHCVTLQWTKPLITIMTLPSNYGHPSVRYARLFSVQLFRSPISSDSWSLFRFYSLWSIAYLPLYLCLMEPLIYLTSEH